MERPRFSVALLHPRYWLTWLGFGLWWLLVQLPYRWQFKLGGAAGGLAMKLAGRRRRIAERNIALCFPERSSAEQARLVRANIDSSMIAFFETGIAWFWPRRRKRKLFRLEGIEYLQRAEREGRGVVLLAMHFTNIDLGGCFLCIEHSIDALYRPHNNPVYDYIQHLGRSRHSKASEVIPRWDVRLLIKRLRAGRAVWYAPDQDYGPRQSVFVPFFGVPAATITSTADLARTGRALVIPFTQYRADDGSGYTIRIYPPLEDFPQGDNEADARRINAFIEERVREHPEQYMWVHRRFKTRPPGEPDIYADIGRRR